MSERNLKAARSYYEEVLSQGKIELIDELIHPDCTVDDPAMPQRVPAKRRAFSAAPVDQ